MAAVSGKRKRNKINKDNAGYFFIAPYFIVFLTFESARIDGCNEFKIFNKIIFPVIIPGVATQAIFTFVGCWNSYVQPSILLFSQEKFTLPILVQQMQGVYKTDYGVVYLGVTLSVVPILLLFMFCSKKILESSMSGAVKG